MPLIGKVAVVTGAGRGLGRTTALLLAKEGCQVVLVARTKTQIEESTAEILRRGGQAFAVQADIGDREQVRHLFAEIDAHFDRVDILINNAGVGIYGPLDSLTQEEVDSVVTVNLIGTIYCTQEAFARMKTRRAGHILNVISTAGKAGLANECVYCASKWGVAGFSESLKVEGKQFGIRVTAFYPGGMNTPFWDGEKARKHQPHPEQFMDPDLIATLILQCLTLPESVAVSDIVVRRS